SAADALGKVGSDIAIPGLLKALEDVDSAVRRSAANALEKIGSDIAIPGLLKALEDADRDVRRSAADVLGKIGSEISPVQLINFLKYRGVKLRLVAAEALGIVVSNQDQQTNLTQALTIVTLISALKDRYPGVRRQAVQSLQKIQNPKSIKLLQQLQLEVFNPEINQAIIGIQEACQFYNYQLTQPSLPIVPTPKTINQIDFAILTAIEPERLALCTALKITNADRTRKDARTYWHKRLPLPNGQHYDIILTQAPDMANVDAALLAADTLNHWQPHAILMVGIAAAAGRDQQLGDLILGKDVYYYERGKATASGVLPEPVMYRSDATLWNRVTTTPNHDFDIHATRPDGTDIFPNVSPGVIASGEQVIAHAAARDDIAKGHRKIKAIEMEGYGVSAAAWQRFDPVRCLVIRALCDYADGEKNDDWHAYAAAVAAGFTKHFLMDMPLEPRNP
ncbi:MAG: HEAT repeat domain-containing protein, partial [Cyanobacteria bacterium P01_A01_bin.114]